MVKYTTWFTVIVFLLSMTFACSKDEVLAPAEIVITPSSTSLVADGVDAVDFEVQVFDEDGNLMEGVSYVILVDGERLGSTSFRTETSGTYEVVAKISNLESNKVVLTAGESPTPASIKISTTSTTFLANGEDAVFIKVEVFNINDKALSTSAFDLFVNGEEIESPNFVTNEPGEYEVVARINDLESNKIVLKAVHPNNVEDLITSIVLESDTYLILADGNSEAEISVKAYDENHQRISGVPYTLKMEGADFNGTNFSTSQAGTYNFIAQVGEVRSEQVSITARENSPLEEISVPVIFHVVHFGEEIGTGSNLPASDIQRLLTQLNKGFSNDFGSTNPNAVDTYIRFRLATRDQEDKSLPEAGINRINATSFDVGSTDDKRKERIMPIPERIPDVAIPLSTGAALVGDKANDKHLGYDESYELSLKTVWNRDEYLNIYVLPIQRSLAVAGFAYLPFVWEAGSFKGFTVYPQSSNVTIEKNEVCVLDSQYALDPDAWTIIHEVGHVLGLPHTFSVDDCYSSDHCPDTFSYNDYAPEEFCPDNLGSLKKDNFLDYGKNLNTLTFDQRERMRHVFNYGYFFSNLKNSDK